MIFFLERERAAKIKTKKIISNNSSSLDVFRKKQEFSGGILNLNHLSCETGRINRQPGSFINHQI